MSLCGRRDSPFHSFSHGLKVGCLSDRVSYKHSRGPPQVIRTPEERVIEPTYRFEQFRNLAVSETIIKPEGTLLRKAKKISFKIKTIMTV